MGLFRRRSGEDTPAVNPFSVYKVLRDLVGLIAKIREEVRLLRSEVHANHREVMMTIEALKTNVLSLINVAEAAKVAADAAAAQAAASAAAGSADQPGIDDLNNQVVAALNVLHPAVTAVAQAAGTPAPAPSPAVAPPVAAAAAPPPAATDPNAPATA